MRTGTGSASLNPKALKAYLGTIKETILDNSTATSTVTANEAYNALINMELVLRGVLPPVDCMAIAGKQLIEPTMVAPCAMAGMLAERCGTLLLKSQQQETAPSTTLTPLPNQDAILLRCKDVKDERLQLLMQFAQHTPDQFFILAYAYYLQAAIASSNDSPILWKKAWDVIRLHSNCSTIQQESSLAIYPLQQLIRIATDKGNITRVSELAMRLAWAWLAPHANDDQIKLSKIYTVFTPKQPQINNATLDQRTTKAQEAMEKVIDHNTNKLTNDRSVIWMTIYCQKEALAMDQLTQKEINMGHPENKCRSNARSTVLLSQHDTIQRDIHTAAEMVRDTLWTSITTTATKQCPQAAAVTLLIQHFQRLEDRARLMGFNEINHRKSGQESQQAWTQLGLFLVPLLKYFQELNSKITTVVTPHNEHLQTLLESALTSVVKVMWMTCGNGIIMDVIEIQPFVQEMLSLAIQEMTTKITNEKSFSLTTERNDTEKRFMDMKDALVTVTCLQRLSSSEYLGDDSENRTTSTFITTRQCQSSFGSDVLTCYLAWSGFHQIPWNGGTHHAHKRIKKARDAFNKSRSEWGRVTTPLEGLLLDIMEADAESVQQKYLDIQSLPLLSTSSLLQSHVLIGLSRTYSTDHTEDYARQSLQAAELVGSNSTDLVTKLHVWTSPTFLEKSTVFHKNIARTMVAESLIRQGQWLDAESFLVAALDDAPLDFDVALALGAFRLRQDTTTKISQVQLLKAAKLDPSKPSPFALLGIWYEENGDNTRAFGCFAKALQLDPSHPIAGRGILRLKAFPDVKQFIDAATHTMSLSNGWAWSALGIHKAMIESDDDLAAICFQEAIRCRDISTPQSIPHSYFFTTKTHTNEGTHFFGELAQIWAELGGCYRRLGRFTAALRSFTACGEEASMDHVPPATLCSWGETELELGLFDDAAAKFGQALQHQDENTAIIAAFGKGRALLALAQRDAQDGKAGAAFARLTTSIDVVKSTLTSLQQINQSDYGCVMKLLGDLYTFGASLPPALFIGDSAHDDTPTQRLRAQVAFIAQGEESYAAVQHVKSHLAEDDNMYKAATQCDLGTNILLQSQILATVHGEGQGVNRSLADVVGLCSDVKESFQRAEVCFRAVIAEFPLYAPAWCGLGCAICASDPLLAQHAFVRCLQLDKTSPEAWSNLGFLYASHNQPQASIEMMNQLTQVADTPLMWICRAVLLEREALVAEPSESRNLLSRATDAYHAALQVTKHPGALLGLSLSCRASSPISIGVATNESFGCMRVYEGLTSGSNQGATLLRHIMSIEDACQRQMNQSVPWADEVMKTEMMKMISNLNALDNEFLQETGITETKNGRINVDVVRAISHYEGKSSELSRSTLKCTEPFSFEVSASRRLLNDPENGETWLELAKQLAKELYTVQGVTKRRLVRQNVESAMRAANKAVSVLLGQLDSSHLDSETLTEALVLSYWVGSAGHACLAKGEEKPPIKATMYNLQRAMMMCPDSKHMRAVYNRIKKDGQITF